MSREVMQMALEALDGGHIDRAYGYIQEALAQQDPVQEHAEQMARLGWQYFECPACGSEGAKAFPKPEQEPVLFIHPSTFEMASAHVGAWKPGHELEGYIPLYTASPTAQPDAHGIGAKK